MRFLQRVRRDYVRAAVLGIFLGGFMVFWPIRYLVHDEYDGELLELRRPAERVLRERGKIPDTVFVFANRLEIRRRLITARTQEEEVLAEAIFSDTIAYDPLDDEEEPYRKLTYATTLDGNPVTISVAMPSAESRDLVLLLVLSIVGTALAVLLITGLATRRAARKLWQPFAKTLDALHGYEIGQTAPLNLPREPITEFDELNTALNAMIVRLEDDFAQVKAFTGRASHELQTPLAVIGTQLDLLLQAPILDAHSTQHLTTAVTALQRLRDLHRALLMLTRIEAASRDHGRDQPLDLAAALQRSLDAYREQSEARHLGWSTQLSPVIIQAEPALVDIVLRNLLGNAVKYAQAGSIVTLSLTDLGESTGGEGRLAPKPVLPAPSGSPAKTYRLLIRNEASAEPLELARVFDAFYRGPASQAETGSGLGLAMVAEVARHYGWDLAYRQEGGTHEVELALM